MDNIIKLFPEDATTFTSNGIGFMDDCTSCTVTEERNGAYELSMEYPVSGKRFNDLETNRIIVANVNPYRDYPSQAFRIYNISKPMNGKVQIDAQHISYDLTGIICLPITLSECQYVETILHKIFRTSNVTVPDNESNKWNYEVIYQYLHTNGSFSTKKPTGVRGVLGGQEGSIIQTYERGEWEFDNYIVRFYSTYDDYPGRGKNRGVTVRYGKNLQDLTQDENIANMYDGVLGYWYNEENTPSLIRMNSPEWRDQDPNHRSKVMALDLTDKFETAPEVLDLEAKTHQYIVNNQVFKPEISIKVSMAVLNNDPAFENVRICDTVSIYFEQYGIVASAKVIKTVYDCKKGRYQSLELGNAIRDLSDSLMNQGGTTVVQISKGANVSQDGATNVITIS